MYCPVCHVDYTASKHSCTPRKVCEDCQEEKDIAMFGVHPSSFDGHKGHCKDCQRVRSDRRMAQKRTLEENRRAEREEHKKENDLFKAHGYSWRSKRDYEGEEHWQLYSRRGLPVSKEQALEAINRMQHPAGPRGDVASISAWARRVLEKEPLFLDTETTGFSADSEVIEVAIVDKDGQVLLDTLVQCQGPISPQAANVHGIKKLHLRGAPTFPEVWEKLLPLFDHPLVVYNLAFDTRLLTQTKNRHGLAGKGGVRGTCLMKAYSRYVGERSKQGDILRQQLTRACYEFDIPLGGHRALNDAQAARQVMLKLAEL